MLNRLSQTLINSSAKLQKNLISYINIKIFFDAFLVKNDFRATKSHQIHTF